METQTLQTRESPIGYLQLYRAKNTLEQIRVALKSFLEAVTGERPEDLEAAARGYLASRGRDLPAYRRDVERFFISMNGCSPKTVQARLSHVRQFLLRSEIELPGLFWRDLRRKMRGNRAVTVDAVPTNEELRKVLFQMPILGKAIALTAASSGARIGELLNLRIEDVDLTKDPIRLTIRAETTKAGGYRIVFASREAREAIQTWLKVREQNLATAVRRAKGPSRIGTPTKGKVVKDPNDPRLFPVADTTVYGIYNRALEKAGYLKRDPRTGYATLHFHTLRKLFRTRLGPVLNQDIIEALMGHEAYLTQAYRRYTLDQLAEFYRKAEPSLWILSETGPIALQVEDTKDALSKELRTLKEENIRLTNELKQTTEKQEKRISSLEAALIAYFENKDPTKD